jgi:hypothetical protein
MAGSCTVEHQVAAGNAECRGGSPLHRIWTQSCLEQLAVGAAVDREWASEFGVIRTRTRRFRGACGHCAEGRSECRRFSHQEKGPTPLGRSWRATRARPLVRAERLLNCWRATKLRMSCSCCSRPESPDRRSVRHRPVRPHRRRPASSGSHSSRSLIIRASCGFMRVARRGAVGPLVPGRLGHGPFRVGSRAKTGRLPLETRARAGSRNGWLRRAIWRRP